MTQNVADEVLGRFARQQHDWFERARKGSLDPDEVMRVVQNIIDRCPDTIFPLALNYDLPLMEMIAAGKYDGVNSDITEEHFPKTRTGIAELEAGCTDPQTLDTYLVS